MRRQAESPTPPPEAEEMIVLEEFEREFSVQRERKQTIPPPGKGC